MTNKLITETPIPKKTTIEAVSSIVVKTGFDIAAGSTLHFTAITGKSPPSTLLKTTAMKIDSDEPSATTVLNMIYWSGFTVRLILLASTILSIELLGLKIR